MSPKRRRARPLGKSGNFIAAWRLYRGYATQDDLARASGINRSVINRLENGKLLWRQDLLEPIAEALDCQPFELIAYDPSEKRRTR